MLKVLPIQSKTEQEAICLRCGVKYDADLLAYSATINDRLVGVCQFKVTDRGGIIKDISSVLESENEAEEKEALFVLGRATLNFIDLTGMHKAYFEADCDEALIRRIGFKKVKNEKGDEIYFADLTNFFCEPCKQGKN